MIPICEYVVLKKAVRAFVGGGGPLLLVKGRSGLGKTETIQKVLRKTPHLLIRGKKSALDLYIDLFQHRDMLVVIDDVDVLLDNKDGQEILRDVTETVTTKTIRWGTQSPRLEEIGIPKWFKTRSRVILLTNKWAKGGVRDAIASRALAFEFLPPWSELYRYAAKWFDDKVVLNFVQEKLRFLKDPDLRVLQNAKQLREYSVPGLPWQSAFDECLGLSSRQQAALGLLGDVSFGSDAARAREFIRLGHGHRSTFYRKRAELKEISALKEPVEQIVVQSETTAGTAKDNQPEVTAPKRRPGRPRKTPPTPDVAAHTLPGSEQGAAPFKTSVKEVAKCL